MTRLVVYCFLAPGQKPRETIFLEGQSDDGPLEIEVNLEEAAQGKLIHTLAARKMISEMEEGTSYLQQDDFGNKLEISPDSIKSEIVTMGLQFSLASTHTSFIAVDKRSDGDEIHVEVTSFTGGRSSSSQSNSKNEANLSNGQGFTNRRTEIEKKRSKLIELRKRACARKISQTASQIKERKDTFSMPLLSMPLPLAETEETTAFVVMDSVPPGFTTPTPVF